MKPQIMPFYYCDGPDGEKGTWTHKPIRDEVMGVEFDPLTLTCEERKDYSYEGPEIIYTFWAKHGPCQVTGCGHRTPIMTSPGGVREDPHGEVLETAVWRPAATRFDAESADARIAPDVPLYVAPARRTVRRSSTRRDGSLCPRCRRRSSVTTEQRQEQEGRTISPCPSGMARSEAPRRTEEGNAYGGAAQDDCGVHCSVEPRANETVYVYSKTRGPLPDRVTCPGDGGRHFRPVRRAEQYPRNHTSPAEHAAPFRTFWKPSKTARRRVRSPGTLYRPTHQNERQSRSPYNGRFFLRFDEKLTTQYSAATREWEARKDNDLRKFWPQSALPYGFMTHHLQGGSTKPRFHALEHDVQRATIAHTDATAQGDCQR